MTPPTDSVEFDRSGTHLTAYIVGELDGTSVEGLEASITAQVKPTDQVVWLDLEGVTFCGSTGVSMLLRIRAHVEAQGARLTLYQPSSAMQRTLELCELDGLFSIWRSDRAPDAAPDGAPASDTEPVSVPSRPDLASP